MPEIPFFIFFLPLDVYELWHSMMSTCLITEVNQQLGYVSTWCTTRVSNDFAARTGRLKPLSALLYWS